MEVLFLKIIHCADLHIDSSMETNLPREKAEQRKEELITAFEKMVKFAVINDVQAIVIAGDLFDSEKTIKRDIRKRIFYTIRSNSDIKFFYLRGNHDNADFFSDFSELPVNLKLFRSDRWNSFNIGEVCITGRETNVFSDKIYKELTLDSSRINIVTMHGQLDNSMKITNQSLINKNSLKGKNIDYLALGHIHSFSEGKLDERGNFCYSGCLEGRGFDETGTKGFVLLEIDEKNRKIKPVFIKSSIRIIYKKNIDITNLEFYSEILDKILLEVRDVSESSLIKINLTGQVSEKAEVLVESFEKQLYERFFYVKIFDESETKIDYEKYRNDFSLKGEFVRLVESKNISEKQKSFIIKTGLRALAGKSLNQENLICL